MLDHKQKEFVTKIYDQTCKAFDKTLDPDVLKMQVEDLSDLNFESILSAISAYRRDGKNVMWPRASKIRELVNPKQSKDGMANEAASRIRKAISDFGWFNSEKARAFIGELGWAVVDRAGGWQYLCESHGVELNQLTFHAQARDLAKAIVESSELGIHNQPIGLSEAKNNSQLNNILKLTGIKEMPKG